MVWGLHRVGLGPTLEKTLPEGARHRRPVLVGVTSLLIFFVVLGPYLIFRTRGEATPIIPDHHDKGPGPGPIAGQKLPPLTMVVQLGHAGPLTSIAYSNDGKWLASASQDGTARLWETATGREIRTFKGHVGAVTSVAFSEDAKYLATGGADNSARLWKVEDGKEVHDFRAHTEAVNCVVLSGDGKWLITGSEDKTARKWDIARNEVATVFRGHTAAVKAAALSSDGKWLVTGSADRTARIWDLATGKESYPKAVESDALQT